MEMLPNSSRQVPASWPEEGSAEQQAFTRLFRPLRDRWPLVAAIFLLTLLVVIGTTLLTPKTYTTTAKLMTGNGGGSGTMSSNDAVLPVLNSLLAMGGQRTAETYAELLQETPVAQRVIDELSLPTTAEALLHDISVKPVTNTPIMQVSATAKSADLSASIANEFARAFVERQRILMSNQADDALKFLAVQLPIAERRMRETQGRVAKYESTNNVPDVNAKTANLLAQAAAIDSKLSQAEVDRKQSDAQLGEISGQLNHLAPTIGAGSTVTENPVLAQLKTQRSQVYLQLQTASRTYTDQHPAVLALKAQLAAIDQEIGRTPKSTLSSENTAPNPLYQHLLQEAAGYRGTQQAADAQIAELQTQRHALGKSLRELPSQTNIVAQLRREAKLAEDVYAELQRKFTEASVAKSTALSDVSIVSPASALTATRRPSLLVNTLAGSIIGLLLGITVALLVDFFDGTVKDERDVTAQFGLPVLANVPKIALDGPQDSTGETRRLKPIVVAPMLAGGDEPARPLRRSERSEAALTKQLAVESFLQLVTSMRYASDKPLHTIAFTSPESGEGKSTIALNSAATLAELQPRVLLIDADLRRPTVHTRLGMRHGPGLSDYLASTAHLDDVIQPSPHSGLDVIASGTWTPNPIKLLQSERFTWLLNDALALYTTVMIDCPALNLAFDAAIVSAKTDGTVLVLSAGSSEVRETKRALRRLGSVGVASVIGVVLNRARPTVDANNPYYLALGQTGQTPVTVQADG